MKLGEFDRVSGYKDNESGLYCGCEYCADCAIDLIRSPVDLALYTEAHSLNASALDYQSRNEHRKAVMQFSEAETCLASRELRVRPELDDLRARILIGKGACFRSLDEPERALSAFHRAETLCDCPALWGQTNREASQLSLFAEMSAILTHIHDPVAWCRNASFLLCDMVDCLPPMRIEPYTEMRMNFARFHENWLSYAISIAAYDVIPEVIIAVQGRDLVLSFIEEQTSKMELDTSEAMEDFILTRRGLRSMMTSDGSAAKHYLKSADTQLPNTEGTNFEKDFAGLRRALQRNKANASGTAKFSILDAPHRSINAEAIRAALVGNEQLLVIFPHADDGHAVLFSANKSGVHYFHLPLLPNLAERTLAFDTTGRNRRGMRRNVMGENETPICDPDMVHSGNFTRFGTKLNRICANTFGERLPTS